MSDDRPAIVLNANQRRHFEVLLARLEDSLTRIEDLLAPDAMRHHVLSVDEQDIPDNFRERAVGIIAALRARVVRLATILDLRPRNMSRARSIAATLSAEAIRIEDSLSSQLRGYGEVHPTVVQQIDPALREMAAMLTALASGLAHHSQSIQKR